MASSFSTASAPLPPVGFEFVTPATQSSGCAEDVPRTVSIEIGIEVMPSTRSAGRPRGSGRPEPHILAVQDLTFWTSRTLHWPSRTSQFGRPEPHDVAVRNLGSWPSRTSAVGRPEPLIGRPEPAMDVQKIALAVQSLGFWTSRTLIVGRPEPDILDVQNPPPLAVQNLPRTSRTSHIGRPEP